MSRPQVSIDRITPRRTSLEPRESMNCKSCRKRKIKCNRMRPSCEACKVFQCPCVYDAIPKKRGPKTDVLETLVKRVDGLEKRLQDERSPISPTSPNRKPDDQPLLADALNLRRHTVDASFTSIYPPGSPPLPNASQPGMFPARPNGCDLPSIQQQQPSPPYNVVLPDAILDSYFARLHGKPFFILDEASTRQRHQAGQLPVYLSLAIYAITARYTSSVGTPEQSLRLGLEYALQARRMIDVDSPSIDGLQALLLLSQAFFAHNCGKRTYMTFTSCVAMVIALELNREIPSKVNLPPAEKEMRRRLFWSVYIIDRFITCGSKRPCLIPDHSIALCLPSWSPHAAGLTVEGDLFNNTGPNIQYSPDSRRRNEATTLLIDVTRILGVTNRYLAAGGVKGDSHFPWHALSNLSKIRQELDIWAAGTQDVFASIDTLLGHPESTTLLLSKLIYHLVHCLLYRPFLPIDLVELRGTGQHQSWQIEATNLCFSHSNAMAELVELGRNSSLVEWPAFVGFCVYTAGTVHVQGVYYKGHEGEVFSSSSEFLTREMHQLSWLRNYWVGIQHQRQMLQTIYTCHAELVRTSASISMRFSPVFHLEDFLDRYPGVMADGAHVKLVDMPDSSDSLPIHQIDRQDPYHYRSMIPSYLTQPNAFPPQQLPPSLPSTHTITHQTKNPAQSPTLNFTHPNNPQPSPPPQPLFPIPPDTDMPGPSSTLPIGLNNSYSPSVFGFSPASFLSESSLTIAPTPPSNPQYAAFPFDMANTNTRSGTTALTPSAQSQGSGTHTESGSEKDPFLSLLEQLAENENSQGGPSELDFFLSGSVKDEAMVSAAAAAAAAGLEEGAQKEQGSGRRASSVVVD